MNDLKPIEVGCLALTYNCTIPRNNGKVVRVGKFLGKVKNWRGERWWDTDTETVGSNGVVNTMMRECYLLRIDDPDLKEEEEESITEDINHEH